MSSQEKKLLNTNNFQQQNLKAWQPLLTPQLVIFTFWVICVFFTVIGVFVLLASADVAEYTKRYDDVILVNQNGTVSIHVDKEMKPPIYFYYKLTDFYQNHRRYVKSRSDGQLRGDLSLSTTSCEPLERDPDTKKILYPCGLIASSFFNDTFHHPRYSIVEGGKTKVVNISWTDENIAWKSDREKKFKDVDVNTTEFNQTYSRTNDGVKLPMPEDEHFIVWMRTAGLPNFKKLNQRIEPNKGANVIPAGSTFMVDVFSHFPVEKFKGTKSIVISTTSWLGGKNEFLGWAYISVGILCFLLAVAFCCKNWNSPRKLGDMTYFQFATKSSK